MPNKQAMMIGLGDVYGRNSTGYNDLSFVYKNITDFQSYLGDQPVPWKNNLAIADEAATKDNVITKFKEVLGKLAAGDSMLFYYTGHGAQHDGGTGIENIKTYCVTFSQDLRYNNFPGINAFLSEDDYASLVEEFGVKCPNGHLITILDCCNAAGLVNDVAENKSYHTVIAATSKYSSAYYDINSAFFSAFSQVWDKSFGELQGAINTKMSAMGAPNTCQVKVAPGFEKQTL